MNSTARPRLVGERAVVVRLAVLGLLRLRVRLRPVALLGHEPAEALLVDAEPLLGRHLEGQVDREAVGVVQRERPLAAERAWSPDDFAASTARSKIWVPARSVCRNASSSA